ncbi:hypothetical protein [Phormidium sp. FACHB-1136]|nr:hypothetical protein [Phormidium sp. FACHB-1136]MBD2426666.1 hypothetical protein [Phormidium sp. FACHB-1136]
MSDWDACLVLPMLNLRFGSSHLLWLALAKGMTGRALTLLRAIPTS